MEVLLGHRKVKNNIIKEQYLLDHLFATASRCREIAVVIDMEKIAMITGLMHDFGKYSYWFQAHICGKDVGRVNHSSAGAKALGYIADRTIVECGMEDQLKVDKIYAKAWQLYREIIEYAILAHHGLYDIIEDVTFRHLTSVRLDYDKDGKYDFNETGLAYLNFLNQEYEGREQQTIWQLYYDGFKEFLAVNQKLKMLTRLGSETKAIKAKAMSFYHGALVRLLLSILKEADIYDSANCFYEYKDRLYTQEEKNELWQSMCIELEKVYEGFAGKEGKSVLDQIRCRLADEIYQFSKYYKNGANKLNLPVGSGKTLTSLRYSLTNANEFGKSRIFYCTAFLSVLEQNASEIKAHLGSQYSEYILEHHSNVMEEEEFYGTRDEGLRDEKEYSSNEYLKESWESPLILTTLVQLANSLFKGKASNLRRFSKLIDSVIIIDEIQSLPSKAVYPFNLMTNFLTHIMNCNILHSTATQPNLDSRVALEYPCLYANPFLISNQISNSIVFQRVDYYSLLGNDFDEYLDAAKLISHVKEQLENEISSLIVLNTKAAVYQIYSALEKVEDAKNEEWEIIYLTTNQCPRHRLDLIEKMKGRLQAIRTGKDKKKLICVSTKLVEAGVNLDFDLVYKSITGVDSVIQCGGRCNREGRRKTRGRLYLFQYQGENFTHLPDLKSERAAAVATFREMKDEILCGEKIDIEKACDKYFKKLYLNYMGEENGRHLKFAIGKDIHSTILDLLSTNPDGTENFKNSNNKAPDFSLKQSFQTAAAAFNLIENESISVIVQYKNEELLESLYQAIEKRNYSEAKKYLKQLQPYTVEIRKSSKYERHVTKELDGQLLILDENCYDSDGIGLTEGDLKPLLF